MYVGFDRFGGCHRLKSWEREKSVGFCQPWAFGSDTSCQSKRRLHKTWQEITENNPIPYIKKNSKHLLSKPCFHREITHIEDH